MLIRISDIYKCSLKCFFVFSDTLTLSAKVNIHSGLDCTAWVDKINDLVSEGAISTLHGEELEDSAHWGFPILSYQVDDPDIVVPELPIVDIITALNNREVVHNVEEIDTLLVAVDKINKIGYSWGFPIKNNLI